MADYLEATYKKFIFKVKTGYLYSENDFWADIQGNAATVGLADFLQKSKGDVAFLETVEPGTSVETGQEIGKIESIKATFGIISPVTGTVSEVNRELDTSPYLINSDPYGTGWVYKIELSDPEGDRRALIDSEKYMKLMNEKIEKEAKKLYG